MVQGRYEVLERLAEGGMGVVYKVYDRTLEVRRVMKLVRPQLHDLPGGEAQRRFREEARTAARLGDHPNFVTLHTFEVDEAGIAYLVMELVDGVDLRRGLEATKESTGAGFPAAFCVEVGAQTLGALEYLHMRRLVHRDISPDNLMITLDPRGVPLLKVIDLGIAKSLDVEKSLTAVGGIGPRKSPYVAPEQLSGGRLDGRSDLYSLAVTLYELVTGELPFRGDDRRELEIQHLLSEPRSFAETDPEGRVPESLRAAIIHGLEKLPADRYQSAAEFREQLEACAPDRSQIVSATTRTLLDQESARTTWARADTEDPMQKRLDHVFPISPLEASTVPAASGPSQGLQPSLSPTAPTVPVGRVPRPAGHRKRLLAIAGGAATLVILLTAVWVLREYGRPEGGDAADDELAESAEGRSEPEAGGKPEPAADDTSEVRSGGASPAAPARPRQRSVEEASVARWSEGSRDGETRRNPRDGLTYAWVPAGEFRFGCSPGDDDCEKDERPATDQTLPSGFWISQTEVTVRAFKRVSATASLLPPAPPSNPGWRREALPIVNVSRSEAARFCRVGASRLPTEVEWEYAARAGEKRHAPPGLEEFAWIAANSGGRLHAVGQRQPNRFGLFDMLGNAAEWVVAGGGHPPDQGVLRGGSWLHDARFVRFSFRLLDSPSRRDPMYGFRCLIEHAG